MQTKNQKNIPGKALSMLPSLVQALGIYGPDIALLHYLTFIPGVLRPYVGHSWLLFLGSKEGWRNQQTAALPDYLSSFSSLHPSICHTLILIIFQDSVLTNGLSSYVNHILQDKQKQYFTQKEGGERALAKSLALASTH